MTKIGISAALTTFLVAMPMVADAAYPAYPTYQTYQTQNYGYPQQQQARQVMMPQQQQVVSANSMVAAQPTRITGTLPRVGSNSTNAGRQYYQPADYDRLADSGLYIGLSAAYSASVMGAISADYKDKKDSSYVPGAFQPADIKYDAVIPLQLSIGAAINNDFRVDFSYLRYGGIEYASTIQSPDGSGGFVKAQATGGAITSNATMLNLYYNIDSYTGYLAGGAMRPYIGAGIGITLNTIADYVILDNTFYKIMTDAELASVGAGKLSGISDIYAYHNGGTQEQLAYMLEGGITTELEGGIRLDFFVRYSGLGKIQNSGSIVVSQTEWLSDGAGDEVIAPYDSVYHYTNWFESGTLATVDVGVQLRLQF